MERAASDTADGGPRAAPWLPATKPSCWRRRFLKVVNVAGALLLLLYIMVVGLALMLLEIPRAPVRLLMKLGMQGFGMIVEHAYALPICKLHVTLSRLVQRTWNHRPYHTRFADIRTEILLAGGGICFIHFVPCMTDNFSYVLVDATGMLSDSPPDEQQGLPACAVDPCDAFAVVEALELIAERYYAEAGGLRLEAVLCTHRHWDHAGGNEDLVQLAAAEAKKEEFFDGRSESRFSAGHMHSRAASVSDRSTAPLTGGAGAAPRLLRYAHPLRVYGGAEEGAPGVTHKLWHGDTLKVGTLVLEALASPGHTKGSMMFRLVDGRPVANSSDGSPSSEEARHSAPPEAQPPPGVLFTGDTLFSGGCGAQFEGCELDIEHCFATVLASCDSEDALLFPGHEYTSMLLEHRLTDALEEWAGVEAPGQFLALCGAYYVAAHRRCLRDRVPTVPFMLKSERLINPHFDRGLLRHADAILAMLDAQTGTRAIGPATGASAPRGPDPAEPPALASVAPSSPARGPPAAAAASQRQDRQQRAQVSARTVPLSPRSTLGLLDPQAVDAPERAGELAAAADVDSAPNTERAAAAALPTEETGPLPGPAAEAGSGAEAAAASGGAAAAAGSGDAAAAAGDGGDAAASVEKAAASTGIGHFATGGNAPAFQFAFLYKQDLDALRDELLQDRLTGPEAAARLLECEQRLFSQSLLTGPGDSFCGEGVEPWEEDAALSDEEGNASALSSAAPVAGPQAQDVEEAEDRSEEPSWDARWPSEGQVTSALKVLGVLPEVPIGPKAPCADQDLPVSLLRLETVLRRLNVSEEHLQALRQTLQKEDVLAACQAAALRGSSCFDLCHDSRRQMQALNSEESGEVLPLRQVVQLLRPTPPQDRSKMERCFRQSARVLREFGRDCLSLFTSGPESSVERPPVPSTSRSSEGAPQDKEQEGPEIIDGADLTGKRRRAVERVFTAHALDQCPLCSCAFHGQPATVRRSPFGSQQD